MELMDIVLTRRSIRKYKPDTIEAEKLEKIAEAFRLAPSARNSQNWKLLFVENAELKEKISKAAPTGQVKMLYEAPGILVAVGYCQDVMTCGHRVDTVDLSIAMSYACLQAHSLGLGTCWMASFREEEVKDALNLPADTSVVMITPIGYADENPAERPRKSLNEVFEVIS